MIVKIKKATGRVAREHAPALREPGLCVGADSDSNMKHSRNESGILPASVALRGNTATHKSGKSVRRFPRPAMMIIGRGMRGQHEPDERARKAARPSFK